MYLSGTSNIRQDVERCAQDGITLFHIYIVRACVTIVIYIKTDYTSNLRILLVCQFMHSK